MAFELPWKMSGTVDKTQKYDRQLRVWGDHGQTSLEKAHVCLVNASAVGTEILKSLVLPGIGHFTIVDDSLVSGEDAGCNFFFAGGEIGKPRAEVAVKYLCEMNEDVEGHAVKINVAGLLADSIDIIKTSSCVIATHLPEKDLVQLSEACWRANVPLLIAHCCGMVAYVRLQVAEHCVVEAHPDSALHDLRLDRPFPELMKYLETQDLATMDKKDHSHTPYVVLLHKFLEDWKAKHGTAMPSDYKEKSVFKQMLRDGIRCNEECVPEDEENFGEALNKANACLKITEVSQEVQSILKDPCLDQLSSSSSSFWILVRALALFVEKEGCLPLRGTLPDMTADSQRYISVQTIYRNKAAEDARSVLQYAQEICRNIGKDPSTISESETNLFCKNASFLRVIRGRPFAEEARDSAVCTREIDDAIGAENPYMPLYVVMRAAMRFLEQHGHNAGDEGSDASLFKDLVSTMTKDWNLSAPLPESVVTDVIAYRGAELPFITGFVGALISQEVIKIVTQQFVPFNNTLIYSSKLNGCATFQL